MIARSLKKLTTIVFSTLPQRGDSPRHTGSVRGANVIPNAFSILICALILCVDIKQYSLGEWDRKGLIYHGPLSGKLPTNQVWVQSYLHGVACEVADVRC